MPLTDPLTDHHMGGHGGYQSESATANRKDLITESNTQRSNSRATAKLERKRQQLEAMGEKTAAKETGEDLDRKRAWEYSIEDSEAWDKKLARKGRRVDSAFTSVSFLFLFYALPHFPLSCLSHTAFGVVTLTLTIFSHLFAQPMETSPESNIEKISTSLNPIMSPIKRNELSLRHPIPCSPVHLALDRPPQRADERGASKIFRRPTTNCIEMPTVSFTLIMSRVRMRSIEWSARSTWSAFVHLLLLILLLVLAASSNRVPGFH